MSATGSAPSGPVEPRTPEGQTPDTGEELEAGPWATERELLSKVIHDGGCQCRGHTLGWTIRYRDSMQLADAVLAAGFRRVAEDPAAVLEKLASDLEDRAWARDRDDGEADAGPQCDGECGNADCHRISAVATWQRAAIMVRDCGAALRGGEQQ